jgi:hypothetical protein
MIEVIGLDDLTIAEYFEVLSHRMKAGKEQDRDK